MKVIYDGPFDKVEVPDAGVVAVKGDPVDVSDEIGARLCEQSTWKRAQTPKSAAKDETAT